MPAGGEVLKMAKTVRLGEHEFEGTPNRDCLRYVSIYGIEGVQTLLRGLYKYKVIHCHMYCHMYCHMHCHM